MQYIRSSLKWPGCKYQLLDTLLPLIDTEKRLIEPFTGSAITAINAQNTHCLCTDVNGIVITYLNHIIQSTNITQTLHSLKKYFTHQCNDRSVYLSIREQYNNCIEMTKNDTLAIKANVDTEEILARFLYLNRHGFNGLVRYNLAGQNNVPFGKYTTVRFPEEEIRAFYETRKKKDYTFTTQSALDTLQDENITDQDIIYCDPPYAPTSLTSAFTTYSGRSFTQDMQETLKDRAYQLCKQKHVKVLISNSNTVYTRSLYEDASEIHIVTVYRSMSCDKSTRGDVTELIAVYDPEKI